MKILRGFILAFGILSISLFSFGCNNDANQTGRTIYESLELDTPELAVEQFLKSFKARDYYAVYLIFSPITQSRISNHINTLRYDRLIKIENQEDVERILARTPPFMPVDDWEHQTGIYLFDSIMLAAEENSAFLIDLGGESTIVESTRGQDESIVDVLVELSSGPSIEEVIIRTKKAPSGRWRVFQVIVPNGDESQIPWSMPTE